MSNIAVVNFNSGEITPEADARKDTEKYTGGCRKLENMIPDVYGEATRRPGTEFIDTYVPSVAPEAQLAYPTLHALTSELPSILSYENQALSYENDVVEIPGYITIPIFTCWENEVLCWENESVITSGEIVNSRNVICYENDFVFYENDIVVALIEIPTIPTTPATTTGTTPVTNATELRAMTSSGSYILQNDIDMAGESWTSKSSFSGILDGNGKTISNLSKKLFTNLVIGAEIHDLTLDNFNVSGTEQVGALAGKAYKTCLLVNITISNSTITGDSHVGALIGELYRAQDAYIFNCSIINCDIIGGDGVGSLIGTLYQENLATGPVSVVSCSATGGSVTGTSTGLGGFIGSVSGNSQTDDVTIHSCHSTVDVTCTSTDGYEVGGFLGEAAIYLAGTKSSVKLISCYSTGDVDVTSDTSAGNVGGFAGKITTNNSVIDCYSTGNVTFNSQSGEWIDIGGFVGYVIMNPDLHFLRCYSTGNIDIANAQSDWRSVGGFIGHAQHSSALDVDGCLIERCFSWGDITIDDETGFYPAYKGGLGGFIGFADGILSARYINLTIKNCYSWGQIVSANPDDGVARAGLIAFSEFHSTHKLVVTNCYCAQTDTNAGSGFTDGIPSGTYSKGLIAYETNDDTATATALYWDTETSSLDTSLYGTGHTTEWMMTKSNYEDAGWDFYAIWEIA